MNTEPNYGNWIRRRKMYTLLGVGLCLLLLALIPTLALIREALAAGGILFAGLGAYLAYIAHQFWARGGCFQRKLWQVVLDHLAWDGTGQALDIGTGNGPLAIALATRHPAAHVTGIDYWGGPQWQLP